MPYYVQHNTPLSNGSGRLLFVGAGLIHSLAMMPLFEKYMNGRPRSRLTKGLPYSPNDREDSNIMSLLLKASLGTSSQTVGSVNQSTQRKLTYLNPGATTEIQGYYKDSCPVKPSNPSC